MTASRPWLRRAAHAAAAAGLALPGLAVVATAAGARAPEGLGLERRWAALSRDANVLDSRLGLDVRNRVAYVFESAGGALRVRGWDLDRLTPRTPALVQQGVPSIGSDTPVAVDERNAVAVVAPPTATGVTVPAAQVYAVRGGTIAEVGRPNTRFPAGYVVLGIAYEPDRDRAFVLGAPSGPISGVQTVGAGIGGVLVDVWRADDLARGTVSSPYPQPLRVPPTCGQVMRASFAAAMLPSRDGKSLFFGCMTNRGLTTLRGPNPGDLAGIAELDLEAAAAGSPTALRLRPIPGNFSEGDVVAIPGKRRLVLTANDSSATNFRVFDADSGYYVGNVGLDDIGVPAIGFDPLSGRGYYAVKPGVGVFDAGGVPVTQGVVLENLAPLVGLLTRPIDVDPVRRRVFVATSEQLNVGDQPFFAVLRDTMALDLPDDDTGIAAVDEPEVAGRTASARTSEAGALGAEFRLVGGPAGILANAASANSGGTVIRSGTRYEQFGAARGVRLSGDEASAEAVTTRQDEATTNDMVVPEANIPLGPLAVPALCADFGFTPGAKAEDSASVSCDLAKQAASAEAAAEPGRILVAHAGRPGAVPAPVQVRSAEASVESHRDPGLGKIVSTMRATAYGIDLMGVVRIGRVTATATAEAHGRRGTAKTTYERTVDGLVLNGTTLCALDCPLWQVRQVVHDAFAGRIRVEFPEPDRVADPTGRISAVTDNRLRHIERVSFDDVPDDSVVAPAMEVIAYLDGTTPSRLTVGLAAVSAQERYRIFRTGGDGGSLPPVPAPTPTVTVDHAAPRQPAPDPVLTDHAAPKPRVAGPAPAVPRDIVERLREGLKVVFRSPRQLAAVAALWALLAIPVYLAARRRLLIDLPFLRRAVEES